MDVLIFLLNTDIEREYWCLLSIGQFQKNPKSILVLLLKKIKVKKQQRWASWQVWIKNCTLKANVCVVLNCVRLLTRVLPYIFEDPEWKGFFWSSLPSQSEDEDESLPLAQSLMNATCVSIYSFSSIYCMYYYSSIILSTTNLLPTMHTF